MQGACAQVAAGGAHQRAAARRRAAAADRQRRPRAPAASPARAAPRADRAGDCWHRAPPDQAAVPRSKPHHAFPFPLARFALAPCPSCRSACTDARACTQRIHAMQVSHSLCLASRCGHGQTAGRARRRRARRAPWPRRSGSMTMMMWTRLRGPAARRLFRRCPTAGSPALPRTLAPPGAARSGVAAGTGLLLGTPWAGWRALPWMGAS